MLHKKTKATLEAYNYRVITANDGLEAIALYAQQPQEIKQQNSIGSRKNWV